MLRVSKYLTSKGESCLPKRKHVILFLTVLFNGQAILILLGYLHLLILVKDVLDLVMIARG